MKVLITGGTGSFGQAFSRIMLTKEIRWVSEVLIYSRDEYKQAIMKQEMEEQGVEGINYYLGDVRDFDRLRRVMDGCDAVIHAAAQKRIEACHFNPGEMVKTNILGSMNVINAARDTGVYKVVALSTDKAYNPVSVYGHSKALMECLFLDSNSEDMLTAVTRYGNVTASRGSVIPRWMEILRNGNDIVPVTHPDCTRFWMTIEQAVSMVSDLILDMDGGELEVPDLPAYSIGDLAQAMKAKMKIIGLPEWEKMHECMGEYNCSDMARRMTIDEIREGLREIYGFVPVPAGESL